MSSDVPVTVDVWRAVAASRQYQGSAPLSVFARLRDSLADAQGQCRYRLEFGRNRFAQAVVQISADAELPLICQRSLQRFLLPVRIEQTLGLLRNESEEAALPPEVEPLLVPAEGELRMLDLVEDELILNLPVVAVDPNGTPLEEATAEPVEDEPRSNPFAALAALKQKHT